MSKNLSKLVCARISEELYTKIETSSFRSKSECVAAALEQFFSEPSEEPIIYQPDSQMIELLEKTLEKKEKQIESLEQQLKIKDQQIFSLIAVQKDLTEKTTEQVKLLADKIGSKKWYEFWK